MKRSVPRVGPRALLRTDRASSPAHAHGATGVLVEGVGVVDVAVRGPARQPLSGTVVVLAEELAGQRLGWVDRVRDVVEVRQVRDGRRSHVADVVLDGLELDRSPVGGNRSPDGGAGRDAAPDVQVLIRVATIRDPDARLGVAVQEHHVSELQGHVTTCDADGHTLGVATVCDTDALGTVTTEALVGVPHPQVLLESVAVLRKGGGDESDGDADHEISRCYKAWPHSVLGEVVFAPRRFRPVRALTRSLLARGLAQHCLTLGLEGGRFGLLGRELRLRGRARRLALGLRLGLCVAAETLLAGHDCLPADRVGLELVERRLAEGHARVPDSAVAAPGQSRGGVFGDRDAPVRVGRERAIERDGVERHLARRVRPGLLHRDFAAAGDGGRDHLELGLAALARGDRDAVVHLRGVGQRSSEEIVALLVHLLGVVRQRRGVGPDRDSLGFVPRRCGALGFRGRHEAVHERSIGQLPVCDRGADGLRTVGGDRDGRSGGEAQRIHRLFRVGGEGDGEEDQEVGHGRLLSIRLNCEGSSGAIARVTS